MHAIKILPETIGLIAQRDIMSPNQLEHVKNLFLYKEYVLITGYVDHRGHQHAWNVMPLRTFQETFEYDPVAIQHDWDLVVQPFRDNETVPTPYKD